MARVELEVHSVADALPRAHQEVLVWHRGGVDRGVRYGATWRYAELGEDEIYGVAHWAEIPEIE
jgi:hypothetical protein